MGVVNDQDRDPLGLERTWSTGKRRFGQALPLFGALAYAVMVTMSYLDLGEDESVTPSTVLAHATGVLLFLCGVVILSAPRHKGAVGAPVPVDGGILLPIRETRHAVSFIGGFLLAAFMLLVVAQPGFTPGAGAAVAASAIMLFYVLPRRAMTEMRIRLDPEGFRFHDGHGEVAVRWPEVKGIEPRLSVGPGLCILLRNGRRVDIDGFRHRWTPSALGAVITYYAAHPEARKELTEVESLDKFRGDSPVTAVREPVPAPSLFALSGDWTEIDHG